MKTITRFRPPRVRPRAVAATAVLVPSLLLAGACSGDDSAEVISLDDEESEGTADAAAVSDEDLVLEWYACMREHGLDMPDPEFDDDGNVVAGGGIRMSEEDQETAEQARAACPMPDAALPGGERADPSAMEDMGLEFAECARDQGYPLPDPDFDSTGGGAGLGTSPFGDVDTNDPEFQAVMEECRHILEAGGVVVRGGDG